MYYSWRSVCVFLVSQLSDLEHDLREAKTKEHDTQHERNYVQVQLSRLEADRTDLQQRLATVTQERNSLENTVAELQDLNRYDMWVWVVIWLGSGPCVLFCGSLLHRGSLREKGGARGVMRRSKRRELPFSFSPFPSSPARFNFSLSLISAQYKRSLCGGERFCGLV